MAGQDALTLAHSWGTFVGIQAAARAPDRFHAYLGMGQVSQQRRAEILCHQQVLAASTAAGDEAARTRLQEIRFAAQGPLPGEWMDMRDDVTHRMGIGTTRDMDSVITGVFLPVWQTPDYTIAEKIEIGSGKKRSQKLLFDHLLAADLAALVPRLEIPAYFFMGRHDYTVGYPLARDYFARLSAPVKGFYTFDQSAHSPAFEEPERMRQILRTDVLHSRASMADRTK